MLSYANEGVKIKKEHMKNILSKLEEEQGYSLSNGTYFDSNEFNFDNAYDVSIIWEERLDKKGYYKLLDDDNFYYIFRNEEEGVGISFGMKILPYIEKEGALYEETLEMIENLD